MVNIDTVYLKVLSIANKEQRGYITPQEFNLMADKAQLEIINDYIHELKMAHHKKQNTSEVSDPIELLNQKMGYVKGWIDTGVNAIDATLNGMSYVIVYLSQGVTPVYYITNMFAHPYGGDPTVEITEVEEKQLMTIAANPLTRPTESRPIFCQPSSWFTNNTNTHNLHINIFPELPADSTIRISFIKKPVSPKWGFVVVNQKPLYNFNTSINFELHPSEEEKLVTRILQLAGVIIEKPDLVQGAYTDQQITKQNQNS